MKPPCVASLALVSSALAAPLFAQDNQLEPKEWTVPWERTRPRDPIMDQAGRVWFVGQVGNYVAYLDPKSGNSSVFTLDVFFAPIPALGPGIVSSSYLPERLIPRATARSVLPSFVTDDAIASCFVFGR